VEVGNLAEDDLHGPERHDVGGQVLAAVRLVPVLVVAVGLLQSAAYMPGCVASVSHFS
jgi:hypothetical protein